MGRASVRLYSMRAAPRSVQSVPPPCEERWPPALTACYAGVGSNYRINKEETMAQSQPSSARDQVRNIVPGLIDLSERVLFGEVWERPGLSKRDRSLITCATLIALGREKQLVGHLQRALDNGLTKNELSEVITHLAFYAGWPAAMTAALVAKDVFEK
jgi:4-carboxymuconolactone decarboxylase